eukprot:m.256970 g.256970  ORF g.256970 m.256970 type:complete len:494 (-) comp20523_c0_seq1:325-1806(-)
MAHAVDWARGPVAPNSAVYHAVLDGAPMLAKVLPAQTDVVRSEIDCWTRCCAHQNIVNLERVIEITLPDRNKLAPPHLTGSFVLAFMRRWDADLLQATQGSHGIALREVQASLPGIVRQMAEALRHVHAHGIIHGDVKLENFLVRRTLGGLHVALCDFGHAFAAGDAPILGGTQAYWSPEVRYLHEQRARARASSSLRPLAHLITSAADCWALGITLHGLVTGQFPGPSLYAHAQRSAGTTSGADQSARAFPSAGTNSDASLSPTWTGDTVAPRVGQHSLISDWLDLIRPLLSADVRLRASAAAIAGHPKLARQQAARSQWPVRRAVQGPTAASLQHQRAMQVAHAANAALATAHTAAMAVLPKAAAKAAPACPAPWPPQPLDHTMRPVLGSAAIAQLAVQPVQLAVVDPPQPCMHLTHFVQPASELAKSAVLHRPIPMRRAASAFKPLAHAARPVPAGPAPAGLAAARVGSQALHVHAAPQPGRGLDFRPLH